jgi:hypothetical protein
MEPSDKGLLEFLGASQSMEVKFVLTNPNYG